MLPSDLDEVCHIQSQCYDESILESSASFAAKLKASAYFSFMAEKDGAALGYIVAVPWVFGEVLKLNGSKFTISPSADSICIHDLSVNPESRSLGVASALIGSVLDAANNKGFNRVFLVAIQGASSYWKRYGFVPVSVGESTQQYLLSYGDDAQYMVRELVT